MSFSRRGFLRASAIAGAALPFSRLFTRDASAAVRSAYGPVLADPAGILDLPAGFSYRVVEKAGQPMSDGYRVPGRPDGMGCFAGPGGTLVLMRNHENSPWDLFASPYNFGQGAPPESYDTFSLGGVSRVVLDATTLERRSSNLVLVGSNRNCAGGVSPWGWLTCEENMDSKHGYVFLCPIDADKVQEPLRIPGYGRCEHEAACVDPSTSIAYLSEDKGDSAFYRFLPDDPASPFVGRLQAMKKRDVMRFATYSQMNVGDSFEVDWVDIDQPDPAGDSLRQEASNKGAAIVKRGEGLWFADGHVYLCSTTGGPADGGQIFRLTPTMTGGTFTLIAQSVDRARLDMPDNICMAPWGELFLSEDGPNNNLVRVLDQEGHVVDFARNAASSSEICGVCFSPDGRALFLNLQGDGLTLCVTGPFPLVVVPEPDPDAGVPDAGSPDAGSPDAGTPDAAPSEPMDPDASPMDPVDAGLLDAAPAEPRPDAGTPGQPGDGDGTGGCAVATPGSARSSSKLLAGLVIGGLVAAAIGAADDEA